MQVRTKNLILLLMLPLILCESGCSVSRRAVDAIVLPGPVNDQPSESVAKRFKEPASSGTTVVDSAIELSEKFAKLSNEAQLLRQENMDLITAILTAIERTFNGISNPIFDFQFQRNQELKERIVVIETQLQRSKMELNQANDLLVEMRVELNNWKTDVLGFRNEIRDAEKAQLEALLKILVVLGGEAEEESAPAKTHAGIEDVGSVVALLNEPGETESQKVQSSGESNE